MALLMACSHRHYEINTSLMRVIFKKLFLILDSTAEAKEQ